jgi:hypothetical protein
MTVIDGDPSKAGPFVLRFRCPDNYKIAPHTHPATEAVTVLEGTFHAGMGDTFDSSGLTAVRRSGFFVIPGGAAQFALCKGTTVIEIHAPDRGAPICWEADSRDERRDSPYPAQSKGC